MKPKIKEQPSVVSNKSACVCYVPKPIQLELRKAWRLIHVDGKYKEGMAIIIDLSGMPENRIDQKTHNVEA